MYDLYLTVKVAYYKDIMNRKELALTDTEKNIEKIFKLIGSVLVTAFCITVIYTSFCTKIF